MVVPGAFLSSPSSSPSQRIAGTKNKRPTIAVVATAVFALFAVFLIAAMSQKHAGRLLQDAKVQVAEDQVNQYNIAKRSGTPMDAYVHAQFAAAAYLQAGDEQNYHAWKQVEINEARRVGIRPR